MPGPRSCARPPGGRGDEGRAHATGRCRPCARLRFARFRVLVMIQLANAVGVWMHVVAAQWILTEAGRSATEVVAAVPAAMSLPFFLLCLPVGALVGRISPVRMMASATALSALASCCAALLASARPDSLWLLLLTVVGDRQRPGRPRDRLAVPDPASGRPARRRLRGARGRGHVQPRASDRSGRRRSRPVPAGRARDLRRHRGRLRPVRRLHRRRRAPAADSSTRPARRLVQSITGRAPVHQALAVDAAAAPAAVPVRAPVGGALGAAAAGRPPAARPGGERVRRCSSGWSASAPSAAPSCSRRCGRGSTVNQFGFVGSLMFAAMLLGLALSIRRAGSSPACWSSVEPRGSACRPPG